MSLTGAAWPPGSRPWVAAPHLPGVVAIQLPAPRLIPGGPAGAGMVHSEQLGKPCWAWRATAARLCGSRTNGLSTSGLRRKGFAAPDVRFLEVAPTIPYLAPMLHLRIGLSCARSAAVLPSRGRLPLARVLLLFVVLLGHLGYGFNVIADDQGADDCDHTVLRIAAPGGDTPGGTGGDHGCHAQSHLVAILAGGGSLWSLALSAQFDTLGVPPWPSQIPSPPSRPPKRSA